MNTNNNMTQHNHQICYASIMYH